MPQARQAAGLEAGDLDSAAVGLDSAAGSAAAATPQARQGAGAAAAGSVAGSAAVGSVASLVVEVAGSVEG